MSRYEEASNGRTRSAPVGPIPATLAQSVQNAGISEISLRQDDGLTNKILGSLPAPEFRRLLPYFESVSLLRGQEIIRSNEFDDYVYFPESAVVSHLYYLSEGTTAAAVIGNDGIVGLSKIFGTRPPVYRTKVVIEGDGLRVKTQVIRNEFARGESFQQHVLTYVSNRLAQVSQRAVCNVRHKLTERLCTWLLMINDRAEDRSLSLTHADIASHLGARRTVISGCCHALRKRGMITYKRGHIIIVDRKMLEGDACECYQVVRSR